MFYVNEDQARVAIVRSIRQLLLRHDFRDAVAATIPTGEHIIIPLLPTDPVSELLSQALTAGGTIHAAVPHNGQLHILAVSLTADHVTSPELREVIEAVLEEDADLIQFLAGR